MRVRLQHDAAVGVHQVVVAGDGLGVLVALAEVLRRLQVGVDEAVPVRATGQVAAVRQVPSIEGHEQGATALGVLSNHALAATQTLVAARSGALLQRPRRIRSAGVRARVRDARLGRGALVQYERDEVVRVLPVVVVPRDVLLGEKRRTREEGAVAPSQGDQQPAETQEAVLLCSTIVPREPVQLVLAPRVVVACLRAAILIAHGEHGSAGREEECHQEIPHLPLSQLQDRGVGARALFAAVPGHVVVVTALLSVERVVLVVVRDQITESEAVVSSHEVDRVAGAPTILLVQVCTAADSRGKVALHMGIAFDELPHGVTELAVPLGKARRPAGGELANEVAIGPGTIPRLSDELHVLEQRVLHQPSNEGRVLGDLPVFASRERGRQIEAEAVHAHLQGPVAEALADPL
mmetsp:Transcript_62551/g.182898  ORF Transcript_62551/g.182898 Transcript_62551/m.182898 type:complete len:408 (+) Transcript_62551:445-1668(+)